MARVNSKQVGEMYQHHMTALGVMAVILRYRLSSFRRFQIVQ